MSKTSNWIIKKSKVIRKMMKYRDRIKKGEYALQLMELNYDNTCNFVCEHCFSRDLTDDKRDKMTLENLKSLADQSHELGVWQWHLQGGEVLVWKNLDEIIKAIGADRFHIMITTNGYLMTEARAKELAQMGIDKITVSLDSIEDKEHDAFRKMDGSFEKVLEALVHAKNAGMQVNVNTVVTKQNIYGNGLLKIVDYCKENDYSLMFVIATSSGFWAGKTDMLVDIEGTKYLEELRQKYSFIHRDIHHVFDDLPHGCRTMNGLVYVTENGDLLSCPFIHIAIGNIKEEPLETILKRGWRVKKFRDHTTACLAGQDLDFIKNKMSKTIGKKGPVLFNEAFIEDDLYPEE